MISGTPPFTTAYASGSRYFGNNFVNSAAVYSEISDGLMTAVLPAAMAPMSGKQQLKNGKFHGLLQFKSDPIFLVSAHLYPDKRETHAMPNIGPFDAL